MILDHNIIQTVRFLLSKWNTQDQKFDLQPKRFFFDFKSKMKVFFEIEFQKLSIFFSNKHFEIHFFLKLIFKKDYRKSFQKKTFFEIVFQKIQKVFFFGFNIKPKSISIIFRVGIKFPWTEKCVLSIFDFWKNQKSKLWPLKLNIFLWHLKKIPSLKAAFAHLKQLHI